MNRVLRKAVFRMAVAIGKQLMRLLTDCLIAFYDFFSDGGSIQSLLAESDSAGQLNNNSSNNSSNNSNNNSSNNSSRNSKQQFK